MRPSKHKMHVYLFGALVTALILAAAAPVVLAADTQAPTAPATLTATPGPEKVDLAWSASTDNVGVTGYYVWRKPTGTSAWINLALTSARTYTDVSGTIGTSYTYGVRARDAAGRISGASPFATAAPGPAVDAEAPTAPASLSASPGDGKVDLAWSASTDNVEVTGYHVWRRPTAETVWENIGNTAANERTYSDTAVSVGTSYTYSVRASDANGNVSDPSPDAAATPGAVPPPAGVVLWKADGTLALDQEWASYGTVQNCAVDSRNRTDTRFTRQSAVVAQGEYAYQAHLLDGDVCYQERSELGQDLPTRVGFSEGRRFQPGSDYYVSFQIRLAAGFPVNTGAWQNVLQWKQILGGSACCPFMVMQAHNGRFWFENPGSGRAGLDMGAATTEAWYRFTVHFLVSDNASVGYVEAWSNGGLGATMTQVVPRTFMQTTDVGSNGQPLPTHARIGIYRNPTINESDGASDAFYDGYTVGDSQAATEANAFAP